MREVTPGDCALIEYPQGNRDVKPVSRDVALSNAQGDKTATDGLLLTNSTKAFKTNIHCALLSEEIGLPGLDEKRHTEEQGNRQQLTDQDDPGR